MPRLIPIDALRLDCAATYTVPGVNSRAEAWTAYYRVLLNDQPFLPGFFDNLWSHHAEAELLVLSGVDPSLTRARLEAGKADERHLRIVDLGTGQTARCSSVRGGRFRVDGLVGRTLRYSKVRGSIEAAYEVGLDALDWSKAGMV